MLHGATSNVSFGAHHASTRLSDIQCPSCHLSAVQESAIKLCFRYTMASHTFSLFLLLEVSLCCSYLLRLYHHNDKMDSLTSKVMKEANILYQLSNIEAVKNGERESCHIVLVTVAAGIVAVLQRL